MAHGNLREFDPKKESIEDFHERFGFYCVANGMLFVVANTTSECSQALTSLCQCSLWEVGFLGCPRFCGAPLYGGQM